MRNPTFSTLSIKTKAVAMRMLFRDGRVFIFDGVQPKSPDDKITTQTCLAALDILDVTFGDDGVLEFTVPEAVPALATGNPTWFRIETETREAILDGVCGPYGDMLVDGDIEADGEIRVAKIIYKERRRV